MIRTSGPTWIARSIATKRSNLLDELHHHVKAVTMLPGLETAENQLLTCLPFLQAQLDWDDEEEATFGG